MHYRARGSMSEGEIITCYSWRSGVGRTMILTDLACILASNGRRVLIMDWNFEDPSLGQYLHPFREADHAARPGVIDLLWDVLSAAMKRSGHAPDNAVEWCPDTADYAQRLRWEWPGGGVLDYISAGRASSYPTRIALFPWIPFMNHHGGMEFLMSRGGHFAIATITFWSIRVQPCWSIWASARSTCRTFLSLLSHWLVTMPYTSVRHSRQLPKGETTTRYAYIQCRLESSLPNKSAWISAEKGLQVHLNGRLFPGPIGPPSRYHISRTTNMTGSPPYSSIR